MVKVLITTHIEPKNGRHILPRNCQIYDCASENNLLKLFLVYDNSLAGQDEYDFLFIKQNQTINVNIDEYGYLGKIEVEDVTYLAFARLLISKP